MNEHAFHKNLVERYTSKKTSDDELLVFFQLLKEGKLDEYLGHSFTAASKEEPSAENIPVPHLPEIPRRSKYRTMIRIAVAACILGIISLGVFLFSDRKPAKQEQPLGDVSPAVPFRDIHPGGERATLTLANGASLVLDSATDGQLAVQGGASIVKQTNGHLLYSRASVAGANPGLMAYNTLTTPSGGQYQVTLPDGTHVWLNAASSITYSTAFNASRRVIKLDGEAYFEVTRLTSAPLTVEMKNGTSVHVLGTDFNVYCYDNEPIRTTLIRGAVRMSSAKMSAILKPGQAATLKEDGALNIVRNADTEEAVAWKNGLFEFNRAGISSIMGQIERWYDVDVVYTGEKSDKQFVGKVPRNSNLSEVLQILELSNIHFKIEGRKVFIY